MNKRSRDWENTLSKDLQESPNARKHFFKGLFEEGYSWREAVSKIIKLVTDMSTSSNKDK